MCSLVPLDHLGSMDLSRLTAGTLEVNTKPTSSEPHSGNSLFVLPSFETFLASLFRRYRRRLGPFLPEFDLSPLKEASRPVETTVSIF